MLLHAVVEWHVIILAPASKRVQKKNRIFIPLFYELLTGIFKKENVSIMQRVPDLEGINSISLHLVNLCFDLRRCQSVLIVAVVEFWSSHEAHGLT